MISVMYICLCIVEEGGGLQKLKRGCDAWETALTEWLDGNIISEESRRYVSNFISIHRLRPGGEDEDGLANPDDMVQDEAVYVTKDMLDQVLETRIGGKTSRGDDLDLMGDSHHMNSSEAVSLGRDIWSMTDPEAGDFSLPKVCFDEEKVKASLQSARDSRCKETKFAAHSTAQSRAEREAAVADRQQATREDVQEWLNSLKARPREDGRTFVNDKQFEAIAKVAERVMEELPNRKGCAPKASALHGMLHIIHHILYNDVYIGYMLVYTYIYIWTYG